MLNIKIKLFDLNNQSMYFPLHHLKVAHKNY